MDRREGLGVLQGVFCTGGSGWKKDGTVLVIRFYSPVEFVKDMDQKGIFSITTSERIFARKAQMNYSWDFCGRTVTTGIWKEIGIEIQNDAVIESYYVYTKKIEGSYAAVGVETEFKFPDDSDKKRDYRVEVLLSKDGAVVFDRNVSCEEAERMEIQMENPQLWWPRPYGTAQLYDLELHLLHEGKVVDTKKQKLGIRTIQVAQEYKEDGKSFQFVVNGKKIFVRGANCIPM